MKIATILGILSGILLVVSYVPQIRTTVKTKNVEGQSLAFWTMLVVSVLGMMVLAFFSYNPDNFVSKVQLIIQILNFILSGTMFALVFTYKWRDNSVKEK